jgi:Tfp pilus assembly protein FimT
VVIPQAVNSSDVQVISGARLVASDLQYAQNLAITTQAPVTVTFDPGGNSYLLTTLVDSKSVPVIHPMTKAAYAVNFATQGGFSRLDVVSASFGGSPAVTFDELGSPSSSGTVVLQAGPNVYRIDVAATTGKVSVTRQ